MDDFFPPLRPSTLDRAVLRRRLRASFEAAICDLALDRVVDVGAGQQPWRRYVDAARGAYVAVDLDEPYPGSPAPDIRWDGTRLPIRDGWATTVLLTEVLEHAPRPEILLAEVARVLAPGGVVYVTVPFLWPVHDAPHDEQRYTPFALRRLLEAAGLRVRSLWSLGGWDASLAVLLGLWLRRRRMNRVLRAAMSWLAYPVVALLDRRDVAPPPDANGMVLGVGATAVRDSGRPISGTDVATLAEDGSNPATAG